MKRQLHSLLLLLSAGAHVSCAESESANIDGLGPPSNITQGGAQDVGEFRRLVEAGEVPPSETFDEVGFFAEHAIDLPDPECEASICAHPMLAVAPTFDGGNWTMGFIGMNTTLSAADLPDLPRHLIVVIEESDTAPLPADLPDVLAAAMDENDRVTLISAGLEPTEPEVALTAAQLLEKPRLGNTGLDEFSYTFNDYERALNEAVFNASLIDLYSPLHRALLVSQEVQFAEMTQRVLLFTSGLPEGGITSRETMKAVGSALAQADIGVSVFGVGPRFARDLPRTLAESSSGNYSVSASSADLIDAVGSEAASGFWPIARNLEIKIAAQEGYEIGDIYGARNVTTTERTATLTSPVLFIGARQGSQDTGMGRRGGGGGWFVELVASSAPGEAPIGDAPVIEVTVRYDDAISGEPVEQEFTLTTPLGIGNNPEPEEPHFFPEISAKPFMMLNMYMAISGALSYFEQGSCSYALGMQQMMDLSYQLWQERHEDSDIADDYRLLSLLTDAFQTQCTSDVMLWPVEGETGCFYF